MKNAALLAGSLIFYALGEAESLLLLMGSVLMNYFIGLHIGRRGSTRPKESAVYRQVVEENGKGKEEVIYKNHIRSRLEKRRRRLFVFAVLCNVGLLAVFKVIRKDGLPLGISFYTFQIISYLADVYRGEQARETSFVRFADYIIMFPRLASGPIVNYGEVRDSLHSRAFTVKGLQAGLKVFTMGLAAKVLLADTIGILWREVQTTGFESISTQLAWLAAIAYSLMLYFDFAGYSLMAIGLGRMLGFELPVNFRTPYMATSVREFYRRWHITLSRWFCQYVYIPLGGSRRGEFRTVCNLLVVWFLTSIWHGITPNFLIWGMLLWLAIVIERQLDALGVLKLMNKGIGKVFSHAYVWVVIPITWMCFAITDLGQLEIFLGRMFNVVPAVKISAGDWKRALDGYGWLLGAGMLACTPAVHKLFRRFKDTVLGAIVLAALFWLCVWRLQLQGQNPFLYRNF